MEILELKKRQFSLKTDYVFLQKLSAFYFQFFICDSLQHVYASSGQESFCEFLNSLA